MRHTTSVSWVERPTRVHAIAGWLTRKRCEGQLVLHVHMRDPIRLRTPKKFGERSLGATSAGIQRKFVSSIGTVVARIQPVVLWVCAES